MRNRLVLVATIAYTFLAISCSKKSDEILALLQELKQQNSDLKAQVTSLQKTTDSLSAALKVANQNIAGMDRKIDSIRNQLTSMVTQINSLSAQLNQANVNIADLQKRIAELQAKCQELVDLLRLLTGSINLSNGLIAYYPFTGNAGDSSGNANHGIINGANLTSDRKGKINTAYNFNGQSWIEVPHSSIFDFEKLNSISISLWFNTTSSNGSLFVQKQSGEGLTQNGFNLGILRSNGHLSGVSKKTSGVQSLISNPAAGYNNSNWRCIVYVFNGGNAKLYLDGKLLSSQTDTGAIVGNSQTNLIFGYGLPENNYFFTGKLDDIRIYNRELTQSEITYLANN